MSEKSLDDIPVSTRELFTKGISALKKNNLDYAVTLLTQCVKLEPGFFDARQALRATQHQRTGNRSGGFFKKLLGSGKSLTRGQLALRSNPLDALIIAEEALNDDPTNESAHLLLADAALASGLPKTAILSLEIAFKNKPKDRSLANQLADALGAVGDRSRAERILRDLLADDPHDPTLNEKLKNLLARRTLDEGGYEQLSDGTGSYRDILRNKEEAVTLEQEHRTVKDAGVAGGLIAQYEARLAKDPRDLKLRRDIAELYLQQADYDQAIRWFESIIEVGGVPDPIIKKSIYDATLGRFQKRIDALDPLAADHATQLQAVQAEKTGFMISDALHLMEANPSDLHQRYELGQLYLEAGKLSEAIAELQKAQNNPNRRIPAMNLLGQAFARRGMNDMAARKFAEALKEKPVFDEETKELHYQLGLVLEKQNKRSEAHEHFTAIYEQDIGYRDIAARVDSYYAAQG
jgi:tetratricopeptide (TPR) repeat protein